MRHAVCCALSLCSAATVADAPHHVERARIVAAEPIYRQVEVRIPERHCLSQDWGRRDSHHNSRATGALVGGVLGGAIGNSMGPRRDRQLSTALGAVAGAAIGAELSGDRRRYERCETVERVEYRDEITGYHITYEYRGRLYHTESSSAPGPYLELAVYAEPLVD